MKKSLLCAITLFGLSCSLSAATIRDGRYNAEKDVIELDVTYGGGCGSHEFSIDASDMCLESYPMQCSGKLVHVTDDFCEALLNRTIEVPNEFPAPSYVTITGDKDSSVTVLVTE